jgi:hypothetical protein
MMLYAVLFMVAEQVIDTFLIILFIKFHGLYHKQSIGKKLPSKANKRKSVNPSGNKNNSR